MSGVNDNDIRVVGLYKAIKTADEVIDRGLKRESIDTPINLQKKINNYVESIQYVHNTGTANDELGLFLVPLDMFQFLDGEKYNPDLYQAKTYQDEHERARILGNRIGYLQSLRANVLGEVEKMKNK